MLRCVRRHEIVGQEVVDREGRFVGTVRDTHPLDGGGEVDLLLIAVGRRFAREHYVPAAGLELRGGQVHLPVTRAQIQDCPLAEDRRWANPADVARGYWLIAAD